MYIDISNMGINKIMIDSFWWCTGTEREAMAINWNTRNSTPIWGRISLHWGWKSTGTVCQGELCSLPPCRHSKTHLDDFLVTCSRAVGVGGLHRPLPTCDSVIREHKAVSGAQSPFNISLWHVSGVNTSKQPVMQIQQLYRLRGKAWLPSFLLFSSPLSKYQWPNKICSFFLWSLVAVSLSHSFKIWLNPPYYEPCFSLPVLEKNFPSQGYWPYLKLQ